MPIVKSTRMMISAEVPDSVLPVNITSSTNPRGLVSVISGACAGAGAATGSGGWLISGGACGGPGWKTGECCGAGLLDTGGGAEGILAGDGAL